MSQPRVVVILLEQAWPARGGLGRRLGALTSALAEASELTVFSCLRQGMTDGEAPGASHLVVGRSTSRFFTVAQLGVAVATGRPLTSAFYVRPGPRRQLRALLSAADPDAVVVHGIAGAMLVRGLFLPSRTIVDFADAEHERVQEMGRSLGTRGLPYRLDSRRIRRWCRRHLSEYLLVTAVSEHDQASYLAVAPDARVSLLPNGVTFGDTFVRAPVPGCVLFLGDLNYPPNRDGLSWFIREVLPLCPEITEFRVVGRGSVAGDDPRIRRLGFVDDLTEEFARAVLMVVPITSGGGTRIKALEAFAAEVPVVSTHFGVRGIGAEADVHYVAAESSAEFAQAIATSLADPASMTSRTGAARQLIARSYTWSRCTAILLDSLQATSRDLG